MTALTLLFYVGSMNSASPSSARSSRPFALSKRALLQNVVLIPSWVRFGFFAIVLASVGFLSLSDSVGASYTKPIIAAKSIVSALVPGSGLSPVGPADLPVGTDTAGHFILWGCVGFMASTLISGLGSRVNALFGLWALSGLIEAAQRYLSFSRSAEISDLVANGTGLLLGGLAASVMFTLGHKVASRRALPSSALPDPKS